MELTSKKDTVPSLFPYQIKRRDNFYFRDHPKGLHPRSPLFDKYWGEIERGIIEGRWIDDEGHWVYMPPKLFFYINYAKIVDKDRNERHPDLRDNEWIIFTYLMCCEGFSGFEGDTEYTCHDYIRRYEISQDIRIKKHKREQEELNAIEFASIPESCKKDDGTFKKYIDPWHYLTRHYLIEEPPSRPLGHALYENSMKNAVILSARGIGKALHPEEKVRVKNGWTSIKELQVGDAVYGRDGKLTNVTAVYNHKNLTFYRIKLRDGREIEACEDHLWLVWDKYARRKNEKGKRGDYVVKSTKELVESGYRHQRTDSKHLAKYGEAKKVYEFRYALPLNQSLGDEKDSDLKIPPYTMGVLLGDGGLSHKSVTITTADVDIAKRVAGEVDSLGYVLNKHRSNDYGYNVTLASKRGIPSPYRILQSYGLAFTKSADKFIPDEYLYSSEDQRMSLLKGLMDTDGYSSDTGTIEYYTTSPQLADDVMSLVRSLGIGCKLSTKKTSYRDGNGNKIKCRDCFVIRMFTDKAVFTLDRKLEYLKHEKSKSGQSRYERSYIVDIEKVKGTHDGVCITVDNEDSTYITKDYIVTHNSFTTFVGDCGHEFITSGIKRMDEIADVNKRLNFGMGSAAGPQLQRSIDNLKSWYYNMPGQYEYMDGKPLYMGPFFKKVQGSWVVGDKIQHIVKRKSGVNEILGSSIQMVALTKDRLKIGAGDRFRRIYCEEFGFLSNAIDVHGANKDSLQSMGEKIGIAVYLGTGGDMEAIHQPKKMFEHPDAYDIFGIPNYWKAPDKKIGLFIPKEYALLQYKDRNGNTKMKEAHDHIIKQREKDLEELDSVSYELEIMFNPLTPDEILRPSSGSILPKQEAQEQLNFLENYDVFRKRAQVGSLRYNPVEPRGVEWRKDMTLTMRPILEWARDESQERINKEGAVIIYEQPNEYIPDGLYWLLYDPAKQSGDAESYHSVLVYKTFYSGPEDSMYDTIVAEWIGRKETLDDNFEHVIKIAKYFNARIFPEINVPGFVDWCRKNNHRHLLEGDAYHLEQEIHGRSSIKRSYYQVGFQMNERKKLWCMRKLRDWLMETKQVDALTGVPLKRTINTILSPRILNEIIAHQDDRKLNFDHISSLLGLMLLIGKIEGRPPVDIEKDGTEEMLDSVLVNHINKERNQNYETGQRCKFLRY